MKKQILTLALLFITYGLIAQDHPSVWDALPMTHSDELNLADSIEKYRTGIIVVKTTPDKKVELEQQTHEFGFGCTVDNQPFEGRMDKKNADMYKKIFLENFNVGVTARAIKWNFMEHEKGMVNFLTNDNILEWTDENNIPLRGHNSSSESAFIVCNPSNSPTSAPSNIGFTGILMFTLFATGLNLLYILFACSTIPLNVYSVTSNDTGVPLATVNIFSI